MEDLPTMPTPSTTLLRRWIHGSFAILAAIGTFLVVRQMVMCWQWTALPGIPPEECTAPDPAPVHRPAFPDPTGFEDPEIETSVPELEIPQWDGASRINIAMFGLRGGEQDGCPNCTDTIMILTVDPVTKTAGMLSIPRDMWVNIPGAGYGRINTAWAIGENAKLPGGGPQLAMQTVSQFIGVPIHYYVQVDFGTFVSFINLIGGIDVYVEERMVLDPEGEGTDHFVLKPGDYRHLTGKRALAYARCRHESQGCSGGDVGRAKRQQQVILAIRDKVLEGETWTSLISQAPQLYAEFSSGVHTNLPLEDAIRLSVLAKDIHMENIRQGVIDTTMAIPTDTTINGVPANVLRPVPDLIRILRDEIFIPGGPLSPLAQGDAVTLMQSDEVKIRIINNTYAADLEQRTASFLNAQGMQVVEFGAPTGTASRTKVILYTSKLYGLRYLKELFGLESPQIVIQPDPASTVDIEVRLGEDWVGRVPTGY
jgi:LCP family protein required for cell wall assembly